MTITSGEHAANGEEKRHSASGTMGQALVKQDEIYRENLENKLVNTDQWDRESVNSLGTVMSQQLERNADTFNFLPTDTIHGEIEITGSTGNHIGTKISASTLTVINNNTSSTNPVLEQKEKASIQIATVITSHCNKLIILSSIIVIGLTAEKLYEYNRADDTETQDLHSHDITESTLLTTQSILTLPEPWIVSREVWGAAMPQTTCHAQFQTNNIAIGDTKTDTCDSISTCSEILKKIQSSKMSNLSESKCDIDYNFLIGHDSRIYEGLAWNATKLNTFNGILKIAFIGDYSRTGQNNTLRDTQIMSLLKFLEKSQNERYIKDLYTITAECCSDTIKSPGDNIFVSMISWNTSRLSFKCVAYNKYRSCKHLHYYYSIYHLDKYVVNYH